MAGISLEQYREAEKRNRVIEANEFFASASTVGKNITDTLNNGGGNGNIGKQRIQSANLLKQAQRMRKMYANEGNKKMVKNIDLATKYLNNVNSHLDSVLSPETTIKEAFSDVTPTIPTQNNKTLNKFQKINYNIYNQNRNLSFDELNDKQAQYKREGKPEIYNQILEGLKSEKATDNDYKNAVETAKSRIKELDTGDDEGSRAYKQYMKMQNDNSAHGRYAKESLKRNHENSEGWKRAAEIDKYNDIINQYGDYAKYGKTNTEVWKQSVDGMSYKDKSDYINKLKTNEYEQQLKETIDKYPSGKEYISSLSEGEKPTAQGFLTWMEDNNKGFYSEQRGYEKNTNSNHMDVSTARNNLLNLDKKVKQWEQNSEERNNQIEYLDKYAKSTIQDNYEDYKALYDEYENKFDNSKSQSEQQDLALDFQKNYNQKYMELKQEHNYNLLDDQDKTELNRIVTSGADDTTLYDNLKKKYGFNDNEADAVVGYAEAKNNEEIAKQQQEEYREFGRKHPVAGTITSVPMSLTGGIGAVSNTWDRLKQAFGSERAIDWNNAPNRVSKNTQELREGVKDDINNELGNFVYDAFASTLDSAATIPLNMLVPGATTILLGSSAASSAMIDAHDKGASDSNAIMTGVGAGIFEGLFEKVSLDKLIDVSKNMTKKGLKNVLKGVAKSSMIEGSEEGFTEFANILWDSAVNGDLSDYGITLQQYMEQGMSESEAKKQTDKDMAKRIAMNVGGGMLGGLFFSMPAAGYGHVRNKANFEITNKGENIIKHNKNTELKEYIEDNYDNSSEVYQLMKNTDLENPGEVGYLSNAVELSEYQNSIQKFDDAMIPAVKSRLEELNVPESDATELAVKTIQNIGNRKDIDAGEYKEAYEQVKRDIKAKNSGVSVEWLDNVDLTQQAEHIDRMKKIAGLSEGKSLKTEKEQNIQKQQEQLENNVNENVAEKMNEGRVVENGKASLVSDEDTKFNILSLAVGTDGRTKVNTDTRQTYDIDDVIVDRKTAELSEFANQYEGKDRQKFFRSYEENRNLSPAKFAMYYNEAYRYGNENLGIESALKNQRLTNVLNTDAIARAFDSGKAEYKQKIKQNRVVTNNNNKGKVVFDNVATEMLNDTQRAAVDLANTLSDVTGATYEFFESKKNENGKYQGENGSYNRKENKIRIDINAGMISSTEGNNLMVVTLAHELTHYAENLAPAEYANLQEFVFNKLSDETGKSIEQLIADEIKNSGEKISEDVAKSELVARGCEAMLTDSESIKSLAKQDAGLFKKIKAKIDDFCNKIIKACKEILNSDGSIKDSAISKEAQMMQKYAQDLRELWSSVVKSAGESNKSVAYNVETQNMLRENYKNEIDEWYKNTTKEQRLKSLGRFLIGRTSDVLKSINVKDYNIYFGKSKIQKILNKHQDMDIEFIKQVPEILEKPILVMDSATRSDSLVILGNLISKKGEPVMVSLLVDPKNKSGIIQDFGIITSAYGKNLNNLQKLINSSNIRYIEPDKKRTNKWLSVLGLQLPSSTTKYGSINKITNEYQNVNRTLKQDRNTDVIKKTAGKLGVSERFLESNLEGRSRESAVQYLKNNSQVRNSFISENGLEVTPVLKEPTSSYVMNDSIKEFVQENNVSYKKLSENSQLREQYAELIEHSKDGSGKKFLTRRAQDSAKKFIEDMNKAMSGNTEIRKKISREIELAKGKASAYDDGMSMKRGQDKVIKEHSKTFEEFISSNITPMYDNAERNKNEFAKNVKDNVENYVKKAEKHFGTTNDYSLAAYIDINGKMLDFSDGGNIRGTDHRGIAEVLDTPSGVSGTEALTAFMNAGNIRIMDTGIDISVEPNAKQISVLRDYIASRNGEIYVDFSKEDGTPAGSARYSKGTSGSRILADINNYFKDGTIPENTYNSMSDFLYQDRNSNNQKLTAQQEEYFKDSKVRDDEGRLMVMYHGTPTGGFTVFKNDLQFFTPNKEYASFYEDPSASSRKSGKEKATPQTYEVYLNMEHPFDIRDEETRELFINDYVKGGWALGINPYEEYKDTTKTGLPSWEEADNIYEWLEENEMLDDYDGIVVDEGGFLGEDNNVVDRGISYVTFNSNQIKNVTNENPTSNEDIRYMARTQYIGQSELEKFYKIKVQDFVDILNGGYYNIKSEGEATVGMIARAFRSNYNQKYSAGVLKDNQTKYIAYDNWLIKVIPKGFDNYLAIDARNIMESEEVFDEFQRRKKQGNAGANKLQSTGRRHSGDMSVYANRGRSDGCIIVYRTKQGQGRIHTNERNRKGSVNNKLNQDRNTNSSREILATALESTVKNDTERNLIKNYRENIDKLYDLDKKLDVVNGALKEMYFMPGNKPTSTIKDLQKQANGIRIQMKRYENNLLKLESTKTLKNFVERENKAAATKQRQIDAQRLKEYRTKQNERFDRMQKRYQDAAKQKVENRKRTEARNKVTKRVDKLNKWLEKPTNSKYIPANFMRATVDLLKGLNQDAMDITQRLVEVRENLIDISMNPKANTDVNLLNETLKLTNREKVLSEKQVAFNDKMQELSAMYKRIESDPDYAGNYSQTVMDQIEKMKETVKDKPIGAMNVQELNVVKDTIDLLTNEITKWNETLDTKFIDGEENEMNIKEISDKAYKELVQRKKVNDNVAQSFLNMQLSPTRMFKRIGGYAKNGVWEQLGEMLNDGQRDKLRYEQGAAAIFDKVTSNRTDKNNQKNLARLKKEKVDIGLVDENGKPVEITKGMMLSVYKHLLNEENLRHAMYGGFTIPEFKDYYKGERSKSYAQNKTRALGVSAELAQLGQKIQKAYDQGATDVEIAELENGHEEIIERGKTQMAKIKNTIEEIIQGDEYLKKWIDCSSEYFDKYSKDAINEVTMKRYSMKKAGVDNYFPIHTDSNYLAKGKEGKGSRAVNLENSGFMQDRVKSTKPIYLEDITNVVNDSISGTGTYVGFLIPQYNYNRILGYTTDGYKTNIKNALELRLGQQATNYLSNLEKDLFGGRSGNGSWSSRIMSKARGKVAQSALTLNIPVTAGQAASYFTAAPTVGWKNLAKAFAKGGKHGLVISSADRELINKYSPLLWYRNLGNVSQDIHDAKNADGVYNKINDKTNGYLFGWIQKADVATVGRLWYAAQYYVSDNFKDLEKGSDEYYKQTAKVFNKIVEETQPNYPVMQRPGVLRSQNEMVKALTMFSTQRMQNYNILFDSIATARRYRQDFKNGLNGVTAEDVKQANRTARRAVTSQIVSAAVLGIMKTAAALMLLQWKNFGDDENEFRKENVLKYGLDQFYSNVAGTIVGGSELYSFVSSIVNKSAYYGISLTGFDAITEFVSEIQDYALRLRTDEVSAKDTEKLIRNFSVVMGIPYAQAKKIYEGTTGWTRYTVSKLQGENRDLTEFAQTNEVTMTNSVKKIIKQTDFDKKTFDKILKQQEESVKIKNPEYSKKEVDKTTRSRMRSRFTKELKEKYKANEMSKAEVIRQMKRTGLYTGQSSPYKTLKRWNKE